MPDLPSPRPLRLALDLDRRIDEVFKKLIHEPWGRAFGGGGWRPAIDVFETDDAYLIEADIPGVAPENVEIRIEGRRLTIRGTRETVTWSRSQGGWSVQVERQHGDFSRTLELDHPVDIDRLEKKCDQGILRTRLPKKRAAQAVEPKA